MRLRSGVGSVALLVVLVVGLLAGASVALATSSPKATHKTQKTHKKVTHQRKIVHGAVDTGSYWPSTDVQHLHLQFGPFRVEPGQNNIKFDIVKQKPQVDGWIVGFTPNLTYPNGKVPPVDVIHLHHAVWLVNSHPAFGAGEEKTRVRVPQGFGMPYKTTDTWALTYMIHNLTPTATSVKLDYDIVLHPGDVAGRAGDHPRLSGRRRRPGPERLPGVRRPPGLGQERQLHVPDRRTPPPIRRACTSTSTSCPTTRRWSARSSTCTRAACTATSTTRA